MKSSRILCVLFVLLAMMVIYLRCLNHFFVNDDIYYAYVMADTPSGPAGCDYSDDNLVRTIEDVIVSQKNHYLCNNGRAVVHIVMQAIIAFAGYRFYAIFIAIVMGVTIWLFVKYSCRSKCNNNPLIYGFAVICFLYLYPLSDNDEPIFDVAYGMNYLFTIMLLLGWLLLVRKYEEGYQKILITDYCLLPIFSFIVGWTHEGFIIPLCGGSFIYALLNLKKLRRPVWYSFIALWCGGLCLVLAPSNFARLGASTYLAHLFNGLEFYMHLRLFWLAVLVIIVAIGMRKSDSLKVLDCYFICTMAMPISIVLGLVANTNSWSLTGAQFFSSILMFALLPVITDRISMSEKSKNLCATVLIVIMIVHQGMIVRADVKLREGYDKFYAEYCESPYGYAKEFKIDTSPIVRPWLYYWFDSYDIEYIMLTLGVRNGTPGNPPILLGSNDYNALFAPSQFFVNENRVPGNGDVYEGERYFWIKADNKAGEFEYFYDPPTYSEGLYLQIKLKALLYPSSFAESETFDADMFVVAPGNDSVRMLKKLPSMWRRVKSINVKE